MGKLEREVFKNPKPEKLEAHLRLF